MVKNQDLREKTAEKPAKGKPKRGVLRSVALFSALGIEVALAVVLPLFFGMWLDKRYGKEPLFTIALIMLGLAVAISILVRYAKLALREEEDTSSGRE